MVSLEDSLVLLLVVCFKRHFRNKPLLVYTNDKATRDLMAIGELERIKSIKSKPGASV